MLSDKVDIDRFATKDEAIKYIMESIGIKTKTDALKILKSKIPLEDYYQSKILKHLKSKYKEGKFIKIAQGSYSVSGIPDICGLYKGKFFGFEVKRPYFGKVSAHQRQFIKAIKSCGGYAGVVIHPEDVDRVIEEAFDDIQ